MLAKHPFNYSKFGDCIALLTLSKNDVPWEKRWRTRLSSSEKLRRLVPDVHTAKGICGIKENLIYWLVVSSPLKNMSSSVGMILPNVWKSKKCSKPPTRYIVDPITWESNQPFSLKSWVPNGSHRVWLFNELQPAESRGLNGSHRIRNGVCTELWPWNALLPI